MLLPLSFRPISSLLTQIAYSASKMQASSTNNTKDSAGKRLGLKKCHNEFVFPGDILARQRGFKWKSGNNVYVGKDQTIHAATQGVVEIWTNHSRKVPFKVIGVRARTAMGQFEAGVEKKVRDPKVAYTEDLRRTIKYSNRPAPYNYHPELWPERAKWNHPEVELDSTTNKLKLKQHQ